MHGLKFLFRKVVSFAIMLFLVISSCCFSNAEEIAGQADIGFASSFDTYEGENHFIYVVFNDDLNIDSKNYHVNLSSPSKSRQLNDLLLKLTDKYGLIITKAIGLPDKTLDDLEYKANKNTSSSRQYYLNKFMKINMSEPNAENAEYIANALKKFAKYVYVGVERKTPVPPPIDINPVTPDLSSFQNYWGANPGLDFAYASGRGASGLDIRVSDCEYDWDFNHEDLEDQNISIGYGSPNGTNQYADHGTAALGISSAGVNGYGINGAVPDADFFIYSEIWGRANAIAAAINDSDPGDVILLEMQTGSSMGYVPAEYDPVVWSIIRAGTDSGVIVVAAAGNGSVNLDDPGVADLAEYKARGDSGAIIIGAGSSDTGHNKLSFSTYGSRVNVQTWGENVMTAGYNNTVYDDNGSIVFNSSDTHQKYIRYFNGTSSASALAAAACAKIQSYMNNNYGWVLTPAQMRDVLVSTGIQQGTGGHIGPFINIRAAIEELDRTSEDSWSEKADIPNAVSNNVSVACNNKIYTVGGLNSSNSAIPYLQCYDPSTDTWSQKSTMGGPKRDIGACALNGKIYAVGGVANGGYLSTLEEYSPATDAWTFKASMPASRYGLSAEAANGKLYAIGGAYSGGSVTGTVEEYNPSTNTWTTKASMPTARKNFAVEEVNGKIYAIGGQDSSSNRLDTVEIYDPSTNTWTTGADMPTPRWGLTCSEVNGKIYAIGGNSDVSIPSSGKVEEYNPDTGTWSAKGEMLTGRSFLSSAEINGKIYAVGGHNGAATSNRLEEFTPSSGSWAAKANIPNAVSNSASVTFNNKVYTLGGFNSSNSAIPYLQCYDPSTDTWSQKSIMGGPKRDLGACVLSGKIYAVGGVANGGYLSTLEEYNPDTDAWTFKASMPASRYGLSAEAVNGKLYAIGGAYSGGSVTGTVEEYNPDTNTWTTKASMPTARESFGTAVVNGKIYAIGGHNNSADRLDTVEIYDPSTNTWTTGADMPTSRRGLTCSEVNGKIYAIGGNSDDGTPSSGKVEEYNPDTDTWSVKTAMLTGRSFPSSSALGNKIYVIGGNAGNVIGKVEAFEP